MRYFPLVIVFIMIVSALGLSKSHLSFDQYAQKIMAKCASSEIRTGCYNREIPNLMDSPSNLSMEDAFKVTKLIQDSDKSYAFCHMLGHNLSAKEVKKDLSKWKEVIRRCPAGNVCNNGCLHGSAMTRFQSEVLSDSQIEQLSNDLKDICEGRPGWEINESEKHMCYHGLGHLNMYVTGGKIEKALDICKAIITKPILISCMQGVFMQIFQPFDSEDKALVKAIAPNKNNVYKFCDQFKGEARGACFRESWPHFVKELETPEGLTKFCTYSIGDPVEQKKCFRKGIGMLTTLVTKRGGEVVPQLTDFCAKLKSPDDNYCFVGLALRILWADPVRFKGKALEVCETATDPKMKNDCLEALSKRGAVDFRDGSEEFYEYCNSLPSPWNINCLSKDE